MAHGKPEAGSLPRRLCRHERVEHLVENLAVDSRPVVRDDELNASIGTGGTDFDRSLAGECIGRVEKEVEKQLP